jgi:hypothetical protein
LEERSEHPEQAEPGKVQRGFLSSMPEGDRRIVIRFGIVITILIGAALWHVPAYNKGQREHREEAASYETYDDEDISECAAGGSDLDSLFCLAEKVVANQEQERGRADLHAQQDMATWAIALLWASAIGIVVSAAGIFLIYATLHETRGMTVATREIGENQSKAYVNVSRAQVSEIQINKFLKILEVDAYFKNTGQTPATDVIIGGEFVVYEKCMTILGSDREMCRADIPFDRIVDLSPDNEPQQVSLGLPKNIKDCVESAGFNALSSIYLRVEGEVKYWDVFGSRYLTQFVFECLITKGVAYPSMARSSEPVECYKKIETRKK